jgi:glycosyltransferase involved in cell wall biosynthesis
LPHVRRVYRISNEIARADGIRDWLRRGWMRRLIADADLLPLVGAALAANPMFAVAMSQGRAVEVPSGVDLARVRELTHAPAPHPRLEAGIPVVLGIGRLRPQKNFGLLIEAAGLLRAHRPLRLAILGGGSESERASLQLQAERCGLGQDFLLAGETHNVFAWLSRSKVFVLPSRWEGSSVALLEAMASGTPVVASVLAGDARQVLDGGRFGRLVDGSCPRELATAIDQQLSDQVVRPGDRVLQYGEPWERYRQLIDGVLQRPPDSSSSPGRI